MDPIQGYTCTHLSYLSLLIACGDGNSETTEKSIAAEQAETNTTTSEDKTVSKTSDDANIARKKDSLQHLRRCCTTG